MELKSKMNKFIILIMYILFLLNNTNALTLQEGLRIVTTSGIDMRITKSQESQIKENLFIVKSRQLPKLDIYANYTLLTHQPSAKFGHVGNIPISEKEFFTYGFKIKQLVYDFGKSASLIKATKFKLIFKKLDTKRIKNIVAINFINSYFDLLEAEKLLRVAIEEVKRFESHLKDTKAMYREGLITKNDLLQAEVLLADARQKKITKENLFNIRESKINNLLLRPLNEPIKIEEVNIHPYTNIKLEDAWREAEKERAEIKIIRTQINIIQEEIKALKAEYLPELYLASGWEFQENRFKAPESNWSVTLGINMNILSGGSTKAKIRQKIAELNTLKLKKEKLIKDIKLEVKIAYLALQAAKQKIKMTKKAVEQAKENLRIQKLRYKEGIGTATDVTDAVVILTKAETNYYKSIYETLKAEARFLFMIGKDMRRVYEP